MMIGTDTTDRATQTTERATGQVSNTAAELRGQIRDIVNGPLRVINAFMSVTVLRWILIAFGAAVVAAWWISTKFGRH